MGSTWASVRSSTELMSEVLSTISKDEICSLVGDELGEDSLESVSRMNHLERLRQGSVSVVGCTWAPNHLRDGS
jgi:hypothetical protein